MVRSIFLGILGINSGHRQPVITTAVRADAPFERLNHGELRIVNSTSLRSIYRDFGVRDPDMMRRLIRASLFAGIAAIGFVATSRTSAAQALHVVSSDATAHFMVLGIDRSAVIETATDIKDVVIADPTIIKVAVLSRRQVSIIGAEHGETNLYFLDSDGRQIDALDVAVTSSKLSNGSVPAVFEYDARPATKVVIFRGSDSTLYTCTSSTCISTLSEQEEREAKTQYNDTKSNNTNTNK
jgi:Flp pilus assembly secretin CpaC